MPNILVVGAGKIGSLIACLLQQSGDYQVTLADINFASSESKRLKKQCPEMDFVVLDVKSKQAVSQVVQQKEITALVSCLPYFLNPEVAQIAKELKLHYFDLTEDNKVTDLIKRLANDTDQAFVPQCGVAPGIAGVIAYSLMKDFEKLESVKIRVGALPQYVNNALYYALTWSTEGLINEYINLCHVIKNGEKQLVQPLQGLEIIQIDGERYEAFNTSGGLGSLADICEGKVTSLNYKTIRYCGHCQMMRFLLKDLKLRNDTATLKHILESAIPKTYQDVVIIYTAVSGWRFGEYIEESYVKKIYPQTLYGFNWSAIQIATASGLCAILDLFFQQGAKLHGLVLQEQQFEFTEVVKSRFGKVFAH